MSEPESTRVFARVAIPVPLGQAFSYIVPPELLAEVRRGARVLCPFGPRKVLGVVLEVGTEAPDFPEDKLKPLRAIVDSEPVLQDELLSFLQEHGMRPGAKVHVVDVAPSLGMMTLKVGADAFALGIDAAKKIRVH